VFFPQNWCSGTRNHSPTGGRRFSPPRRFCRITSLRNRPPLALNALHLYCMLAILAPQWQGGNTSPCHCEAGIPCLGVPPVKITPNRIKYSKLHSRWCNFPSSDASCPPQGTTLLPVPTRLPPPSQDPSQHALCLRSLRRGVFCASASARSHEKFYFFRIVACRSIPNRDSHFPSFEQRALRW
jgi:hypothetical protein